MIRMRHQPSSLWSGFLHEDVSDLWEPWMRRADDVLNDETLVERVLEAQGRRWKKSRTRGRLQTPAEVVLRFLVLKHIRDWSYQKPWSAKCERTWCIEASPGSGAKRCRMPRRWAG